MLKNGQQETALDLSRVDKEPFMTPDQRLLYLQAQREAVASQDPQLQPMLHAMQELRAHQAAKAKARSEPSLYGFDNEEEGPTEENIASLTRDMAARKAEGVAPEPDAENA